MRHFHLSASMQNDVNVLCNFFFSTDIDDLKFLKNVTQSEKRLYVICFYM